MHERFLLWFSLSSVFWNIFLVCLRNTFHKPSFLSKLHARVYTNICIYGIKSSVWIHYLGQELWFFDPASSSRDLSESFGKTPRFHCVQRGTTVVWYDGLFTRWPTGKVLGHHTRMLHNPSWCAWSLFSCPSLFGCQCLSSLVSPPPRYLHFSPSDTVNMTQHPQTCALSLMSNHCA